MESKRVRTPPIFIYKDTQKHRVVQGDKLFIYNNISVLLIALRRSDIARNFAGETEKIGTNEFIKS